MCCKKPKIDLLAVKLNAVFEPFEQISLLSNSIANDENVKFFIDSSLVNADTYINVAEELDIHLYNMRDLADANSYDAAVIITDKELYMVKPHVFLRPATLVVGLTCTHGTTSAEILAAVSETCKTVCRSMKSIAVISTSLDNEEEIGGVSDRIAIRSSYPFFPCV